MFADFGIVNFWTYLLGATLIVLAPGPDVNDGLKLGLPQLGWKKKYETF